MPRWDNENRTPLGRIRNEAGFTVERAAVAIGITGRTLSRYEHGVTDITIRIGEMLADLYQVSFDIIRQAVRDTWDLCREKQEKEVVRS